jgi:hypothetical protein
LKKIKNNAEIIRKKYENTFNKLSNKEKLYVNFLNKEEQALLKFKDFFSNNYSTNSIHTLYRK